MLPEGDTQQAGIAEWVTTLSWLLYCFQTWLSQQKGWPHGCFTGWITVALNIQLRTKKQSCFKLAYWI